MQLPHVCLFYYQNFSYFSFVFRTIIKKQLNANLCKNCFFVSLSSTSNYDHKMTNQNMRPSDVSCLKPRTTNHLVRDMMAHSADNIHRDQHSAQPPPPQRTNVQAEVQKQTTCLTISTTAFNDLCDTCDNVEPGNNETGSCFAGVGMGLKRNNE